MDPATRLLLLEAALKASPPEAAPCPWFSVPAVLCIIGVGLCCLITGVVAGSLGSLTGWFPPFPWIYKEEAAPPPQWRTRALKRLSGYRA